MIILSAIGRFFVKIGRWIRDTAWVQPLLIVGGIFLIIFSIPYLTKWVSSWFSSANASESFYKEYKLSLSGAENATSEADGLMKYMIDFNSQNEEARKKYGTKFFLVFTEEGCDGCAAAYEGFKILRDNWNSSEFKLDDGVNEEFKMYTIFTDEVNSDNKNLFKEYFYEKNYIQAFEEMSATLTSSYYYINQGGDGTSYASNISSLVDSTDNPFAVPTILLVDFGYDCPQINNVGVTEALFSVDEKTTGSGNYGKARTLFDCWRHTDKFGPNYHKN